MRTQDRIMEGTRTSEPTLVTALVDEENPSACRPMAANPSPVRRVLMTPSALAKARKYAELVLEERGTECMFWLLQPQDAEHRVVTDVLFAQNQRSTVTRTTLAPEDLELAAPEAEERGMRILGWSHSHGGFEPFHSRIDHGNVETVVEQLASANIVKACRKVVLQRKGARIAGQEDGRLRVTCPKGMKLPAVLTVELPVTYGYVYSVTVNALGSEPDARIGIQTLYPLHGITEVAQYQSRVRIVRDARLPRAEARKTRQMLADIDERTPARSTADVS